MCGLLFLLAVILLRAMSPRPASALEVDTPVGRWTVNGYSEGYAVFRTDRDTQRQRPAGIFNLKVAGELHRKVRLFVDTDLVFGGTPERADGFGLYNTTDTFQDLSPSFDIDEAYIDVYLGPVDLRIGKQKVAWGVLDTVQPTDVLNPRVYLDPFVMEEDDRKIGVPALKVTTYLADLHPRAPGNVRLAATWVPVPVATRFPLEDERWFPPAAQVPELTTVPDGALGLPNELFIENTLVTQNVRPPQQLDEGAIGLRLAGQFDRADWSLYFYDGSETTPNFNLATSVVWPLARAGGVDGFPPASDPIDLRSRNVLTPRFERIRVFGFDTAFEVAGFTIRTEAAYGMDRLFPRSTEQLVAASNIEAAVGPDDDDVVDALFAGDRVSVNLGELAVVRDAAAWGVGADTFVGDWQPLFQVNQTILVDNNADLLVPDVDTQLLFVLRKAFFADRLDTETAVSQGLARGYTLGVLRLTYAITDNLRIRGGYVLIAGSRRTVIGQYHDNDQGFLQLRYSH